MPRLHMAAEYCNDSYDDTSPLLIGSKRMHLNDATVYISPVSSKGEIRVVYRGTDSWTDWFYNLNRWQSPFLMGKAHRGFMEHVQFTWSFVTTHLAAYADGDTNVVHFMGHSLGGACALIAAARFAQEYPAANVRVTTFGAPRALCPVMAMWLHARADVMRIYRRYDPVTMLPYFGYEHCGRPLVLPGHDHGMQSYTDAMCTDM